MMAAFSTTAPLGPCRDRSGRPHTARHARCIAPDTGWLDLGPGEGGVVPFEGSGAATRGISMVAAFTARRRGERLRSARCEASR